MKIVATLKSARCDVRVVETDWVFNDEPVCVVLSTSRKTGNVLTRFATRDQARQILSQYRTVDSKTSEEDWL